MILFEIGGLPIPWKVHAGFGRKSFNPRFKEKEFYQWQIKSYYNQALPLAGPIKMDYTYHMPIPKGTSKAKYLQMLNGIMHPIKRPDLDNLNKFLSDCFIGIVIEDDSQIVDLHAKKIYSEIPKTIIKLESLCR